MRLLTNELREYINSRPWPTSEKLKLVIDVDEASHVGDQYCPHLAFTLYRDNFNKFTSEQQMIIANILQELHKKIRDSGVPTTLEVKSHVPRD